jgi:uncharacterized Zn-binding protein involved in type VI secretion
MTRMWAVAGDATSSGGQVITGSPFTDIDGKPVARVNDKATCPTHKGTFPIVDGDPTTIIDGEAVALHGSSLSCGCKVIAAQQVRVFVDTGGGGGGSGVGSSSAGAAVAASAQTGAVLVGSQPSETGSAKEVLGVTWSYGPDATPLSRVSRHYADLNVHVETRNYAVGETVEIAVRNLDDGGSVMRCTAEVDVDGRATAMNVFQTRHVALYASR